MESKLKFLISVSLKRKIKSKWFLFANAILLILIVSIANIDSIITFFGGDFDEKQKIHIVDETNVAASIFEEQIVISGEGILGDVTTQFEIIIVEDEEFDYEKVIEEEKDDIVIYLKYNEENYIEAKVISDAYIEMMTYQTIVAALNNTKSTIALLESDIDMEELTRITTPVSIERVVLDESKDSEQELQNAVMTTIFPFVVLPFFMLTIFLVQMIGAEVNDEKSTRGMEIIISSVSPEKHFFAKILAGNLFVVIQGGLLFIFGGIALLSRKIFGSSSITDGVGAEITGIVRQVMDTDLGDQLIYVIPLTLILMLLTFVAYSLLAGILASMTTNIEDFQQLQTPIIIISLIGYYLAIMAGVFTGAVFIKVFSFIPLISAILSPSLLVLGQIGVTEVLISIALVIGLNFLLIKYGLKVYKVGILNYSTTGLWKKMFKALKS